MQCNAMVDSGILIIVTWFNAALRNRSWILFLTLSTDKVPFAIGSYEALALVDITWMKAGAFSPDILPYFGDKIVRRYLLSFEVVTLSTLM